MYRIDLSLKEGVGEKQKQEPFLQFLVHSKRALATPFSTFAKILKAPL
jgi:hypothetical protein